jgi:hypothetical protein
MDRSLQAPSVEAVKEALTECGIDGYCEVGSGGIL